MTSSDYISIVSVIVAIAAFLYSYFTNTKKYVITSQYRTEILDWYAEMHQVPINKPGYGHFNHEWLSRNYVEPDNF